MANPLYLNSKRNGFVGKRTPYSSGGKPHNKLASGTLNTGSSGYAAPWEAYHLSFRSFEDGVPIVESLIKELNRVSESIK